MNGANGEWGDAGVTEQQIVLEDAISIPSTTGGTATRTLQRAGYLRKLRMYLDAELDQSAATGAASKTPYGGFAGMIKKIRIEAAGRQPLYSLSGFGATIYNEIQNRDGGVLAYPAFISATNITEATALVVYTTPATGAQTYHVNFPIEYAFSLPVFVRGVARELGLWLLQDRSIDLSVEVEWNNPFNSSSDYNAAYSGGTGLAGTATVASTSLKIERELYSVPENPQSRPNEAWAHQVIEHEATISGSKFRFDIPASGLVMRAVLIVLDSSGDPVEYTDFSSMDVIYGANTTPIRRSGWGMTQEYLQDYGRMPPKGVVVHDFYKWGMETLKLAKDSEALANFRLEGEFSSTSSGTVKIILDTLVRVLRQG